MKVMGCYFMAHNLRKNASVIRSNLTGKIPADIAMQLIAIAIALRPDTGVVPIGKKKEQKEALKVSVRS